MTTTDPQDIAARCLAARNDADPDRRRALVAALWTGDAADRDPVV